MKNAESTDRAVHPQTFTRMKGPVRIASKAVYVAWAAAVRRPGGGEYFILAATKEALIDAGMLNGIAIDIDKCSKVVVGPHFKTISIAK